MSAHRPANSIRRSGRTSEFSAIGPTSWRQYRSAGLRDVGDDVTAVAEAVSR